MGYITNFIVYTLAMVGVIAAALLVFKNVMTPCGGKSSKYLKLVDTLSLGQRKTLYIVSTGKEQFLLAGDMNTTCLISKLDKDLYDNSLTLQQDKAKLFEDKKYETHVSFKDTLAAMPKQNYMDKSNIGIKSSILSGNQTTSGKSVMRNIAEILK